MPTHPYSVHHIAWQDETAIELTDTTAGMTARVVPRLGANLFSLWSEARQHEVLYRPPNPAALLDQPSGWGTPILMPPNRVERGAFTYNGHSYQFDRNRGDHHMHGLVLRLPWEVDAMEATPAGARAVVALRSGRFFDVMRQFPHTFTLRVEYRLAAGELTCNSWVKNECNRPMPFGLGFHTYLNAPGDHNRWHVRVDASRQWQLAAGLPTGELLPVSGPYDLRGGRPLGEHPLDDIFTTLGRDKAGWSQVALTSLDSGLQVVCEADEHFPHWVLYSGSNGRDGFFAAEPYGLITNGFNLNLPPEVTGMRAIAAGAEAFAGTWRLRLNQM